MKYNMQLGSCNHQKLGDILLKLYNSLTKKLEIFKPLD